MSRQQWEKWQQLLADVYGESIEETIEAELDEELIENEQGEFALEGWLL